jgi:acyl-[acyl-carrier-protein]-phospholipid O-acyltransferase/long-chain-fatty-acid--[acyl-carrier-protein] ligase
MVRTNRRLEDPEAPDPETPETTWIHWIVGTPARLRRALSLAQSCGVRGYTAANRFYISLEKSLKPTIVSILVGVVALSVAILMALVFARRKPGHASWPARGLCLVARGILALRYRIRVKGSAALRQRGLHGILFLPNHPALIDPVIVTACLHGQFGIRPLALENQIGEPIVRAMANLIGVLRVPALSELEQHSVREVQHSIDLCIEALKQGENVLLYPAGSGWKLWAA